MLTKHLRSTVVRIVQRTVVSVSRQKVDGKATAAGSVISRATDLFPECVARVPVSLGGLGVRLCSPSFAFATATVRNRLRDRRKALHSGECVWSGPESVSKLFLAAAVILECAEEVSV